MILAYAWFYIKNIVGGIDAYFYTHTNTDIQFLKEELTANENFQIHKNVITNNIKVGYRWAFRRSAGQPAIIALTYGLLAATLAKLTKGVIYTDDGAWDYKKFPADPNEFIIWYFRTKYATNECDIELAENGVNSIKKELLNL